MFSPEIIVIGAGIIGASCAYELARAGAQVTVLDARRVGDGASQASAGVLAPFIEGAESSALRDLGSKSLALFAEFLDGVGAGADGPPVPHGLTGTLEIALDDGHAAELQHTLEALRRLGVEARWLDAVDLLGVEPLAASTAIGGLLIPSHGFVSVPGLMDALTRALVRRGATFALETRVSSIDSGPGGRIAVTTDYGVRFADRVVLAAGSWAGQVGVEGTEPVRVRPVRGQLLHLRWPMAQPIRHVLWGRHCYLVPWPDGRVLVGATVEDVGFDERATAAGVRDLLDASGALVPQLRHASFVEARVGLRPASPDALPVVGLSRHLPGLIYATGHYRNGVLLAPLTAKLVTDAALDRPSDPALAMLSPARLGL